jgi:hypothetical protein
VTKIVQLRDKTFWDRCRSCGKPWKTTKHASHGRCRSCASQKRPFDLSIKPVPREVNLNDKQQSIFLENETKRQYGYTLSNLTFGSNQLIIHKCDVCGQPKSTPYKLFLKEKNLAHPKCKHIKTEQTNLERYGTKCSAQAPEIQEKRRQTIFKKYGVEHTSQVPEIQEKRRQTVLLRYGVENPYQSPSVKRKIRQTMLSKYGVEHPSQSSEIQEKRRQTVQQRYGVENLQQSTEVQEKSRQTMLKKYGVEYPSQSKEIRKKITQTNMKRLGVENPAQSLSVQQKIKQTTLENYGVENINQLPENRNRLKEWCVKNPDKIFTSKPELEILEWVRQYYPDAGKYRDKTYEIDIFIPEVDIGIEYNGLYHHQEDVLEKRYGNGSGRNYHFNKTRHFESKGIRLIHIFAHEWEERQQQVKSFLLSAIGKNVCKIGARQCDVIWTSDRQDITEIHQFLKDYHIQGAARNTKYAIKTVYNEEIVAVATFGGHHRNNRSREWVLTRFCTKIGITVQGLLSKISKLASRQLKGDILSWAHYRISTGNGYQKAGWILDETLRPDYFYHDGRGKAVSKQSRQKRLIGTPKEMTEKEHAELDGLTPVYDCGKLRYIYKYKKKED